MPTLEEAKQDLAKMQAEGDQQAVAEIQSWIAKQKPAEAPAPAPVAKAAPAPAAETKPAAPAPAPATKAGIAKPTLDDLIAGPRAKKDTFAGEVGRQAAIGAGIGVAAPHVIGALGSALSLYPPTYPAGVALVEAGLATRTGMVGNALMGAIGGALSETAGQLTERAFPDSPKAAFAARVAGGFAVPGSTAATKAIVGKLAELPGVSGAMRLTSKFFSAVQTEGTAELSRLQKALFGAEATGVPQQALHTTLAKGAQEMVAAADNEARKMVTSAGAHAQSLANTAPEEARNVIRAAQARAAEVQSAAREAAKKLDKSAGGALQFAQKVQTQSAHSLNQTLGTPRELSKIGETIREGAAKLQSEADQLLHKEYGAAKTQVDQVVREKMAARVMPDSTNAMKDLKSYIGNKAMRVTKEGVGAIGVVESKMEGLYAQAARAFETKTVDSGTLDAMGRPITQTFKTDFDALSGLRRRMWEIARSGEMEGYGAAVKQEAAKIAGKIHDVQAEYAGPSFEKMQGIYREGKAEMIDLASGKAKKLLATDKVNPELFSQDPQAVAGTFFKSKAGVEELTRIMQGDTASVSQWGREYLARQLADKSATQIETYLAQPATRDWVKAIPGLEQAAQKHATDVRKIEQAATGAQAAAKGLTGKAAGIREGAQKETAAGVAAAQKEVAGMAEGLAGKAGGKAVPMDEVRRLFRSGSPDELSRVAKVVAGTPGGSAELVRAAKQELAIMPKNMLRENWETKVGPLLKQAGGMSAKDYSRFDAQVRAIFQKGYDPDRTRRLLVQLTEAIGIGGTGQVLRE